MKIELTLHAPQSLRSPQRPTSTHLSGTLSNHFRPRQLVATTSSCGGRGTTARTTGSQAQATKEARASICQTHQRHPLTFPGLHLNFAAGPSQGNRFADQRRDVDDPNHVVAPQHQTSSIPSFHRTAPHRTARPRHRPTRQLPVAAGPPMR